MCMGKAGVSGCPGAGPCGWMLQAMWEDVATLAGRAGGRGSINVSTPCPMPLQACLNACNRRGKCISGFCHCNPGTSGRRMTRKLSSAAHPLFTLRCPLRCPLQHMCTSHGSDGCCLHNARAGQLSHLFPPSPFFPHLCSACRLTSQATTARTVPCPSPRRWLLNPAAAPSCLGVRPC